MKQLCIYDKGESSLADERVWWELFLADKEAALEASDNEE